MSPDKVLALHLIITKRLYVLRDPVDFLSSTTVSRSALANVLRRVKIFESLPRYRSVSAELMSSLD